MADNTPRPTPRRPTLLAPLVIGGVVLVILIGLGLSQLKPHAPQPPARPAPPAAPTPIPPRPPPLTRADLIAAAEAAASRYAEGDAPATGADPLVGRTFAVREPFGCQGPQPPGGPDQAHFEIDPANETLRLLAQPVDWTPLPLVKALSDAADIEAVEGFWIRHPWTKSERCLPLRQAAGLAAPTPPSAPTLGLAEVFRAGDSRVARHANHPYEAVSKIPDGDTMALSSTYRLGLEGRVSGFADGRAVHCWSETVDHRPVCLIAVQFDAVRFENGGDGRTIREWRR